MPKPVAVVVGVGPGNGAAFARTMASAGHAVALMSRNEGYLSELAKEIDGARVYPCDATDSAAVERSFAAIKRDLGAVDALLYNAGPGTFGSVEDVTAADLESAWRINTLGLYLCAKQVIDDMKARGSGNIVVTGATASLRGGARFAAFASAKAAQRNLAQSMARHLGPQGIHVSYVIVDGVIDLPRTRAMFGDKPDGFFLKPEDIARTVLHLVQQPRSAWTFELDVRPFQEKW